MLILNILEDGLFAAMAAVGFSSISHTPRRCYAVAALAAAIGHAPVSYTKMTLPTNSRV